MLHNSGSRAACFSCFLCASIHGPRRAGTALHAIFDVCKFEIVRDFLQIISLFFAGLKDRLPQSFRDFYGNISDFFSICFTCWFTDYADKNKVCKIPCPPISTSRVLMGSCLRCAGEGFGRDLCDQVGHLLHLLR